MPITLLPTPPSRTDSPGDFSNKADALLGSLPVFVTEANASAADVSAKQATASAAAVTATASAGTASTAAASATAAAAAVAGLASVSISAAMQPVVIAGSLGAARTAMGLAIGTDVAPPIGFTPANDSLAAHLAGAETMTGAKRGAIVALSDAATITPDFAAANNFSVTLAGSRTLGNPANLAVGQSGAITITQDGVGFRTLAFAGNWKFAGGTAPALTTTPSAIDVLVYYVDAASRITARLVSDVK